MATILLEQGGRHTSTTRWPPHFSYTNMAVTFLYQHGCHVLYWKEELNVGCLFFQGHRAGTRRVRAAAPEYPSPQATLQFFLDARAPLLAYSPRALDPLRVPDLPPLAKAHLPGTQPSAPTPRMVRAHPLPVLLLLLLLAGSLEAARGRSSEKQNPFRRAATGAYQALSGAFGEENLRAAQRFFSRLTDRFVYGVDVLVDTLWRIWTDLLEVIGIDASNLTHYFSPAAVSSNPTRALLLVGSVLIAYWFVSLFLGFFFYLLHVAFGRFFWIVRVILFALSCVYILQKYEGEPEHAILPLCFVVAVYFMTGPVGFYWRRNRSGLEEKIDHLDGQIRLLNTRLLRVIESLDRTNDQ